MFISTIKVVIYWQIKIAKLVVELVVVGLLAPGVMEQEKLMLAVPVEARVALA